MELNALITGNSSLSIFNSEVITRRMGLKPRPFRATFAL